MNSATLQDERACYFFTVRSEGFVVPDRTGVELPPGADLEACARFLADRLMRDEAIATRLSRGCEVEIRDARGEMVDIVVVPGSGA